eukprot:6077532-Amphidinium_carterae.1
MVATPSTRQAESACTFSMKAGQTLVRPECSGVALQPLGEENGEIGGAPGEAYFATQAAQQRRTARSLGGEQTGEQEVGVR